MDIGGEKLIRDVRGMVREAEDLIRVTAGDVEERTREARAKLAGALVVARESCNRLERAGMERVWKSRRMVRDHPLEAMAAALGLGFLTGWILVRLARKL